MLETENRNCTTHTPQKFENTEDDIIDVAKPTGFSLLGVMEATCPVNCDIGCTLIKLLSSTYGDVS